VAVHPGPWKRSETTHKIRKRPILGQRTNTTRVCGNPICGGSLGKCTPSNEWVWICDSHASQHHPQAPVHPKGKVELAEQCELVYQTPCKNCKYLAKIDWHNTWRIREQQNAETDIKETVRCQYKTDCSIASCLCKRNDIACIDSRLCSTDCQNDEDPKYYDN